MTRKACRGKARDRDQIPFLGNAVSTPSVIALGVVAILLLFVNAISAGQSSSPSARQSLKIVEGKDGIRNVFVSQGETWHNLTAFERPHHIYAYSTSPDGKYVLVWHEANPPRVLSVYDVSRIRRVNDIILGYGGEVRWNEKNHIIHIYGCGAGCKAVKVVNLQGNTVFEAGGRPIELSPSGRYLAIYTINWVGRQDIELYDLFNRSLVSAKKPAIVINGVGHLDSISWNDERKIAISYTDAPVEDDKYNKRAVSIDLTRY